MRGAHLRLPLLPGPFCVLPALLLPLLPEQALQDVVYRPQHRGAAVAWTLPLCRVPSLLSAARSMVCVLADPICGHSHASMPCHPLQPAAVLNTADTAQQSSGMHERQPSGSCVSAACCCCCHVQEQRNAGPKSESPRFSAPHGPRNEADNTVALSPKYLRAMLKANGPGGPRAGVWRNHSCQKIF